MVRVGAQRFPAEPAVWATDGELSYRELDELANRVGHAVAARGVRRGDRVAIWLDKSTRMIAAMQGVLRVGAAYVPIDPLGPVDRAAAVIADCTAKLVITTDGRLAELRAHGGVTGPVFLIDWSEVLGSSPEAVFDPGGNPDDPAYILYTSGSTGSPKGVCLSHANALAFVDWAATEIGAEHTDRFANHAPPQFDLSVLDIYAAFRVGASVHLVPHEHSYAPRKLVAFLLEREVTIWYSVPAALMLMTREGGLGEADPPALRVVLFAGEPYPVRQLRELRNRWPHVRFLNLYGPTETNVCTFHEVPILPDGDVEPVPIGRACSGDRVWAVRADGQIAGVGEEGELVVSGPTVMLGYWGRPAQQGPYRTGDRVVLGADGAYRYLGRSDGMVKLRGHRIELGEIENVLRRHPGIAEAAVSVAGEGLTARLVAWVVPVAQALDLLEVKRHCAGMLPRYMIVDSVRWLDELPRGRTGKIDRRRLGAPAEADRKEPVAESVP
ncbi:amino acid adenylation domain-containing protein [Nocardia terpenica]|nr:amino acid adenylation domain-containing protein [Nocardia terpenica]MBF6105858.1 amino acid adenylation domain-containing protein [Nocardia terpenica]MBF6113558.1 amino acid adenylation domain-containing protein [Nocardia terpenica]MBF6119599.1 amino acid adenylation domain-containing protein [Nocardia terpenica]MBF6152010.1 amino acid adenylation domain-containing protein [Nocardia terpenica]